MSKKLRKLCIHHKLLLLADFCDCVVITTYLQIFNFFLKQNHINAYSSNSSVHAAEKNFYPYDSNFEKKRICFKKGPFAYQLFLAKTVYILRQIVTKLWNPSRCIALLVLQVAQEKDYAYSLRLFKCKAPKTMIVASFRKRLTLQSLWKLSAKAKTGKEFSKVGLKKPQQM